MNTEERNRVSRALSCLYTDLLMLQDGSWIPDDDSINASLSMIEGVSEALSIELHDNRDDLDT